MGRDKEEIKKAEEDGRNREWEDRARVNVQPPAETETNIERDFEPEITPEKKEEDPAY